MSIFKAVSDDGDSVDDHFYDENDGTNWRMEVFHDVLQNYVQLVLFRFLLMFFVSVRNNGTPYALPRFLYKFSLNLK